jgi:hypothetical protein
MERESLSAIGENAVSIDAKAWSLFGYRETNPKHSITHGIYNVT